MSLAVPPLDARNCLRSDMQNWTYQSAEKEFDRYITAFYR